MLQLDKCKVIAIITEVGGRTSHSAILARMMNIPAVVGTKDITSKVKTGDQVIVDGFSGTVIINPTPYELELYTKKIKEYQEELAVLKEQVSIETRTKTGKRIHVTGNIAKPRGYTPSDEKWW